MKHGLHSPSGKITLTAPFIRDAVNLKRIMLIVLISLIPCVFAAVYNTGYQILLAKKLSLNFWSCVQSGLMKVLPIILVSYCVGIAWEIVFVFFRKREISEGFWVTGVLYPLTLPSTIFLWQVAAGISFGVIFTKGIGSKTGYNVFNPVLLALAFVFFAYPQLGQSMSLIAIDVISVLACLLGLAFLLMTGVVSWRIVLGCVLGTSIAVMIFHFFGNLDKESFFNIPFYRNFVLGGYVFYVAFIATDPQTSCATNLGQWIYGFLIGALSVVFRALNPGCPGGMIFSLLIMNAISLVIDEIVVSGNIKRRMSRWKIAV